MAKIYMFFSGRVVEKEILEELEVEQKESEGGK